MALIGKIRKRGGIITIIIGIALAAFVLGDFWRKSNKGNKQSNAGEVLGDKITRVEFEKKVAQQEEMSKQQTGKEMSAAEKYKLEDDTWKQLVRDIVLGKEYDDLGLAVSPDELWDLVQGKEPHQYILQNFSDPQTGKFNPEAVRNFLKTLDQREEKTPGTKAQWLYLEDQIKADRIYNKYVNLIKGGYYIPKAMAKQNYIEQNQKAVLRFFVDKYSNIPDTKVTVTPEDLQAYYDKHKHEYEITEASRDIEYVTFDIVPSAADLKKANTDITRIYSEFTPLDTSNIMTYVNKTSDDKYDSTYYKKEKMPAPFDSTIFKSKVGDVIGPLFNDYTYSIAKVMAFEMRPDSMKASHILISYAGAMRAAETITRTKEKAKKMADSLLLVIKKNPKLFDTLAKSVSDDEVAKKKMGDLDWFTDVDAGGKMISSFTNACAVGKVGDVKVVETDFGFHIIKVTGKKKLFRKVQLAVITKKTEPSKETTDDIYNTASAFAGENTTMDQFNTSVPKKKLTKKSAPDLKPMTNNIPGLDAPREIVRWVFDEATKKGDVSKVFDLQTCYVVAYLKEIREKGIPPLEQIKTQIEPFAKVEKKAEMIIKKITAMKTAGISIETLAVKDSSKVDTLDHLTFSSYSLPGFGPEPKIIGNIFTMKPGTMSEPLKGNIGVYVVYLDRYVDAPVTKDYKQTITQLLQSFSNQSYEVYPALEKNAKVVDNRWMFY